MHIAFKVALFCGFMIFTAAWFLSKSSLLDPQNIPTHASNAAMGAQVFHQTACATCHTAPNATDKTLLSGGQTFKTDFGTFTAPNISTSPTHGIGDWTVTDFANALQKGVSPQGQHYYPVFPYTSYARMSLTDIADLFAYMQTLPASDRPNEPHQITFPYTIRRGLGLWKQLYLNRDPIVQNVTDPTAKRGQYLVEATTHCAHCHTPRTALGGLKSDRWLVGGPNPNGIGRIPNITPHETGIGTWSETEIVNYLKTGFTPDFDSAGGTMVAVIETTSKLPDTDLQAIAKYLKSIPALETEKE